MSGHEPHLVYFSTGSGEIGFHDTRTQCLSQPTALYPVYEPGHNIWSLAVNPFCHNLVATASSNYLVELWDTRNARAQGVASVKLMNSATSVQWNVHGNLLACGSFESQLRIMDATSIVNSDLSPHASLSHVSHIAHDCPPILPLYRLNAHFHPDPAIGFRVCSITSNAKSINFYSSKTGVRLHCIADVFEHTPTVMAYHPSARISCGSPVGSALVCGDSYGSINVLS